MRAISSAPRRLAGAALAVAAVAMPLQRAGGMDYFVVPPGMIALAIGAAIVLFVRPRWALVVPLLIALFLSVAAVVAPSGRDALSEPGDALLFASTLLHTVGLFAGLVFTVAALVERKADTKNALPR